ncbi:MAG TPA: MarR family transcriptional regulator [Tissierellia bacterium]|nr:MarR family transcriptional regulator [Tissierellia bacterium]
MIEKNLAIEFKVTAQKISSLMQMKFDEYGLTFGLLYLMKLIENNPHANQKELASKMRFTEGAMSLSVKRLMNLGMIEKVQLESDMRNHKIVITDKGREVLCDYQKYLDTIMKDMFEGFSEDELKELNDFISRINKNLDKVIIKGII